MAIQYGKGGVKGHITSRCPHKALFCRVVLESKGIYIYLVRRGGRKHILLDTAELLPWQGKTAGVVSGRCGSSNVYVCPYMENAIAVLSQIEEMILKNNQIDGRTINLKAGDPN